MHGLGKVAQLMRRSSQASFFASKLPNPLVSEEEVLMTVESDRMLMLLQELAAVKQADKRASGKYAAAKKRTAQIKREMKALAAQKKRTDES